MEIKQNITDPQVLAEQKAYKTSKQNFRNEIKKLSDNQCELKIETLTTRYPNSRPRIYTPSKAHEILHLNKVKLRHLQAAFAIFRGKDIPEKFWKYNTETKTIVRNSVPNNKTDRRGNLVVPSQLSQPLIDKLLKEHVKKAIHSL